MNCSESTHVPESACLIHLMLTTGRLSSQANVVALELKVADAVAVLAKDAGVHIPPNTHQCQDHHLPRSLYTYEDFLTSTDIENRVRSRVRSHLGSKKEKLKTAKEMPNLPQCKFFYKVEQSPV